jgi:Pre-mRNA splicing Prp18-interacting factor
MIARDEFDTSKQGIKLNFESKRDRWNGYDPSQFKNQVIEEWNVREALIKNEKS